MYDSAEAGDTHCALLHDTCPELTDSSAAFVAAGALHPEIVSAAHRREGRSK